MKVARASTLALLVSALLVAPGIAEPSVQSGTLPHGATYLIAPDAASPTAAIDLWFRAPDDGYASSVPGLARVATTAAAAAKLVSGRSLAESVAHEGGRLTIEVFPDIIGVGVVVPAEAARRMLASLSAAYFAPSIDETALHAAQSDTTILAVQQQYEPDLLAHDLLFARLFTSGPAHEPPIPFSAVDVSHVTLDDVTSFAHRAFRAGNAFVSLAGAVDPAMLSAVTEGNGTSPADAPIYSAPARPVPQPLAQRGALPAIGLAWTGPPISDERAATALDFVADYLFRPGTGTFARQLEDGSARVALSGQFITLHDPGVMLVTVDGSDDAGLQSRIADAVNAMQRPLSAAAFAAAREAFLYHLGSDTQTASAQADNLGWYAAEGAASYAPGGAGYTGFARSLDPDYVAAMVRRYLKNPAIVRITPSAPPKGSSS